MTKVELHRRIRGWKQVELAKAAGLDKSTVSQTERMIRKPYPAARRGLAVALGVPEAELFLANGWPAEVSEDILTK